MSQNITEVRLLSVPLENDYKHTIWFPDPDEQFSYFVTHTIAGGNEKDFSYQRKDKVIKYPKCIDDIGYANYVMYKNTAFSDKWYYAFITDMEYSNPEKTNIYIETDVMQTYMFDYFIKPSFVEREHVLSDKVGEHTVPEGLELGEYIANRHEKAGYGEELVYVIAYTQSPYENNSGNTSEGYCKQYTGMITGVKYLAYANNEEGITGLRSFINAFDENGKGDAIQSIFMLPKKLVGVSGDTVSSSYIPESSLPNTFYVNAGGEVGSTVELTLSSDNLNGHEPRNKKLFTFPYRYLLVSNNSGTAVSYNYEDFKVGSAIVDPSFKIEGVLCPGGSIRMFPRNYKGVSRNDDEGINGGKYPIVNWSSDMYTNWLTQNAVNIGLDFVNNAAQIITGIATAPAGGGIGIISGVSGIAGTMAEINKQSIVPHQVRGNVNAGDVVTASKQNDFHFYEMSIKKEYAEIIDSFFDMFGYKVNQLKVPNVNHRTNYWYTKTIDVNIDVVSGGKIQNGDIQKIKNVYNQGVTFWRSSSDVGNYNASNAILIMEE